jgi:hypothetical protein
MVRHRNCTSTCGALHRLNPALENIYRTSDSARSGRGRSRGVDVPGDSDVRVGAAAELLPFESALRRSSCHYFSRGVSSFTHSPAPECHE